MLYQDYCEQQNAKAILWHYAKNRLRPLYFNWSTRGTKGMSCWLFTGSCAALIQSDTKKRELLKNATKIEEIQEKKITDRN